MCDFSGQFYLTESCVDVTRPHALGLIIEVSVEASPC